MALVMSSSTPLVLLNEELMVQAASGSFCRDFSINCDDVVGQELFALGDGEWAIPQLRSLLTATAAGRAAIDAYEIDMNRAGEPPRRLIINAHVLDHHPDDAVRLVVAVTDVTQAREDKRARDALVLEKNVLLQELNHRVANSLQIIAGIILMKAARVESEETRAHLQDAHKRVMSIAAVQAQLHASGAVGPIDVVPYLSKLCSTLATSMISDNRPITIKVVGEGGMATPREAESIGLIATELVMNAIKHAFPTDQADGRIVIAYEVDGPNWKLSVADNGCGRPDGTFAQTKTGLGTGIVKALAQQLGAKVETLADPEGTTVSITHATFLTRENRAA